MGDIYTNPPQSRNEAILRATIDSTEYTDPPQSRIEDLLLELKEAIEEGGGGGTSVVPNPESEATAELEKVKIGTTTYSVLKGLGTAAKKDSTNAVTQDSSDLVESGAVYSALDSKQPKTLSAPIVIGGAPRTTVEAALGALEDSKEDTILAATPLVKEYDEIMRQEVLRLIMDTAPTANSGNAVTSGGVKSAVTATVDLLKDTTGWTGKNRMIFDVSSTSGNGVNLTLNGNKTFTVNTESGGATALTVIRVGYITEAGQYILNGCPEGGGDSTYRLDIRPNGSSSPYSGSVDSGSGSNVITVNNNDLPATVNLRIPSGAEISDKLFKPMIRRPNTSPDYEPYHESVEEELQKLIGSEDTVSLESGLSVWTINNVVKYGKVCTLNLSITASTAITTSALIGTLPSGFRPKAIIFVPVGHPNYSGVAKIDTNGEITFTPPTGVSVTNICIVTTFVL